MGNAGRALIGKPEGNNLQDLGIGRRMILKWLINRVERAWSRLGSAGRLL
jgi:hypothetical protein